MCSVILKQKPMQCVPIYQRRRHSACDICAQLYWNSNPCNVFQYINGGYSVRYMCSAILKLKPMQCFSIYRWEDIVQEICVQWYWNTNPCNVFPSISGGGARKAAGWNYYWNYYYWNYYWSTNQCTVFPSIRGGGARKAGVKLRRLHAHCLFHKLKDVINGLVDWWRLTTEPVHI